MPYTDYLLYGIIGVSVFLFLAIIILFAFLVRNRRPAEQEQCPTCGQILEPGWTRCPFCSGEVCGAPAAVSRQPLGFLFIRSGSNRGTVYKIDNSTIFIGSGNQNDVIIPDNRVALRHARVFSDRQKFFIQDMQSPEGTLLNQRVIDTAELRDNDLIELAGHSFVFKVLD